MTMGPMEGTTSEDLMQRVLTAGGSLWEAERYAYGGRDEGVPPGWNHLGSAVCPRNYDYHANQGLCFSRY